MKRPLKSDQPGDVSIEQGKVYNFGFAIHDDYADARFHHVSLGYKMALDNAEAELNVEKSLPDHTGLSFGVKARQRAHSRTMQLLPQRRKRAKSQVSW